MICFGPIGVTIMFHIAIGEGELGTVLVDDSCVMKSYHLSLVWTFFIRKQWQLEWRAVKARSDKTKTLDCVCICLVGASHHTFINHYFVCKLVTCDSKKLSCSRSCRHILTSCSYSQNSTHRCICSVYCVQWSTCCGVAHSHHNEDDKEDHSSQSGN